MFVVLKQLQRMVNVRTTAYLETIRFLGTRCLHAVAFDRFTITIAKCAKDMELVLSIFCWVLFPGDFQVFCNLLVDDLFYLLQLFRSHLFRVAKIKSEAFFR